MDKYRNRHEAGKVLAEALRAYAHRLDVIVLALPRGGVPVAFEIAETLGVPLDVFIVRKLGVPSHSELAMGAIATGGITVFNKEIIQRFAISKDDIQKVINKESAEISRRELAYRGHRPFPNLKNKTIILVDDGIATGASIRAAMRALKNFQPKKIIIAVPVADNELCQIIESEVDELICPLRPKELYAVGAWYDDFSQTEDEEVKDLLATSMIFGDKNNV